jgi:uncharacterized integral membrane protein
MSRWNLHRMADSVRPVPAETADIDNERRHTDVDADHRTDSQEGSLEMFKALRSRAGGAVVTAVIVGLTLATANIHFGLGGLLFTLNALGYLGLAALIVIGAAAPMPLVSRFSWFPRVALAGYAAMTIAGYLVMGPYFTLGWIAKGIEVALIATLLVDVIRVYGSPMGLVRSALTSVAPVLPARFRPAGAAA